MVCGMRFVVYGLSCVVYLCVSFAVCFFYLVCVSCLLFVVCCIVVLLRVACCLSLDVS